MIDLLLIVVNYLNILDFLFSMANEVPKSVKRFGPRYGRRTKLLFGQIEEQQRATHKCPYCKKVAVRRKAAGIWHCKKCGVEFTGKAFTPY